MADISASFSAAPSVLAVVTGSCDKKETDLVWIQCTRYELPTFVK